MPPDLVRKHRSAAVIAAALIVTVAGQVRAAAETAPKGESIFQQKCAACHTIGGGNTVGPDLKDVITREDRDWLKRFISAPDRMLASGDPRAERLLKEFNNIPMPNLQLTGEEIDSVLEYLGGSLRTGGTAPHPSGKGDAGKGRGLFTGATAFHNGGTPCIGCHGISGMPMLGGGSLGPDLTGAFGKFGDSGLAGILASPPFPTMKPIFESSPLTTDEQSDLLAFFRAAGEQPDGTAVKKIGGIAAGGTMGLMALSPLVWRRRLRSVRKVLVEQSPGGREA